MNKRFLRFRYAAIKRYGAKYWAAGDGYIELDPEYYEAAKNRLKEHQRQLKLF